ncbi:hypothetical protein HY484_03720 [Candidatus Woesearchaeota archaeon]|nr:hypothetical protein [Candidatus Woesearchaeota archaeon]
MSTLIDIAKQFKQCDNETIRSIYTLILLRLKGIQRQIQKHEHEFNEFPIKENPVASMITLTKTEIDALQRLPDSCFKIKAHALDLSARLVQYRDCIGTAFCKTAHNAYDWLANNIITALMKEIRRDVNDAELKAEINNEFTKFYAELIENTARTSLLNNVQQDTARMQPQQISEKQKSYVETKEARVLEMPVPKPPRKKLRS